MENKFTMIVTWREERKQPWESVLYCVLQGDKAEDFFQSEYNIEGQYYQLYSLYTGEKIGYGILSLDCIQGDIKAWYLKCAKELWEDFLGYCVDPDTNVLLDSWEADWPGPVDDCIFNEGTPVSEVESWFDKEFYFGVVDDIKEEKTNRESVLAEKYSRHIVEMLKAGGMSLKEMEILTPDEVFAAILEHNGIKGYDYALKRWIWDIYRIDLKRRED